jgi:pSer/pThr/pTyr-binding forkhead associated (FHA) protein
MPNLIVEHPPQATAAALDGTLSVGRGADNDIVIDHPTVSRHHAVIERIAGEYFLTDLGSRNGTRVNGRSARERKPIAHGAKIRFGQVRVTFLVSAEDPDAAPTLQRMPAPEAGDPGILFDCLCGTRLWAKTEAAGGIVECGKCKREVVVPETSTNKDNSETVSGMILAPIDPQSLAAPVQTGTCSICQWHTSTEDQVKICPSCGLTFHEQCWTENCGCSAYGCPEVNAHGVGRRARPETPMDIAREEVVIESGHEQRADIPAAAAETRRLAEDHAPIAHAMLGASLIGTVLGLMAFGVLALAVLVVSQSILVRKLARRQRERKLMFAAAAISLVGTIAGVAVSSMWWLGVTL